MLFASLWLSSSGTSLLSDHGLPVGARSPHPCPPWSQAADTSRLLIKPCSHRHTRSRTPASPTAPQNARAPQPPRTRQPDGMVLILPRDTHEHRPGPRHPCGEGGGIRYHFLMVFIIWQPCSRADPSAVTHPMPCAPPARRPAGAVHSYRLRPFSSPGLAPCRHQLTPAMAQGKVGASLPRRHLPTARRPPFFLLLLLPPSQAGPWARRAIEAGAGRGSVQVWAPGTV